MTYEHRIGLTQIAVQGHFESLHRKVIEGRTRLLLLLLLFEHTLGTCVQVEFTVGKVLLNYGLLFAWRTTCGRGISGLGRGGGVHNVFVVVV